MSQASSFVGYSYPSNKYLHTIAPSNAVPLGYLDNDNILFIQHKIAEVLNREFKQRILIDRASVIRVMQRVIEERLDTIPKMNQRVIMYICNDFRTSQIETDKHLNWEAHYTLSQRSYDPSAEVIRYDAQSIKTPNRLGLDKVGGTARFYFV